MLEGEILFVGLVVVSFVLFGVTLAYASVKSARLHH
jgi:hypothetical protein